jgi:transposase
VDRDHPRRDVRQIAERCNGEQFNALVGTTYAGIVISDRWNGFEHRNPNQRQVCWSHIDRDFRRHSEGLAEQKTFGEQGLELSRRVFAAWRAVKRDHHDRDQPIQTELRRLLDQASPKSRRSAISAANA